jgi:hypothetical protein
MTSFSNCVDCLSRSCHRAVSSEAGDVELDWPVPILLKAPTQVTSDGERAVTQSIDVEAEPTVLSPAPAP